MNRVKKEELKKYNDIAKNMSKTDKKNYDLLISLRKEFDTLVNKLHYQLFSEEYDYMLDSSTDAKRRTMGENPMSDEYINKMNEKRIKLGFLALSENGYARDGSKTIDYCKKLISSKSDYEAIH